MKLGAITLDCNDPESLGRFWGELTGRIVDPPHSEERYVAVRDPKGREALLLLQKVEEPKTVKNRAHIDLWVAEMDAEAERAVALGATYVKKYRGDEGWIWMEDPEGNEFCICHASPEDLE